jgi:hypothetical protein
MQSPVYECLLLSNTTPAFCGMRSWIQLCSLAALLIASLTGCTGVWTIASDFPHLEVGEEGMR